MNHLPAPLDPSTVRAATGPATEPVADRVANLSLGRRSLIGAAAAATGLASAGMIPGLQAAVYAAGSDKPEKEEVRIGFIPLTDCASVVMASVLEIGRAHV